MVVGQLEDGSEEGKDDVPPSATLEATQGQMDSFFSQLPYKRHIEEVASVGD